jgi:hypothetical protein
MVDVVKGFSGRRDYVIFLQHELVTFGYLKEKLAAVQLKASSRNLHQRGPAEFPRRRLARSGAYRETQARQLCRRPV